MISTVDNDRPNYVSCLAGGRNVHWRLCANRGHIEPEEMSHSSLGQVSYENRKDSAMMRFERELTTTGRTLELFAFPCGEQKRPMVGVTFSDITARKRAAAVEKALQKSERIDGRGKYLFFHPVSGKAL